MQRRAILEVVGCYHAYCHFGQGGLRIGPTLQRLSKINKRMHPSQEGYIEELTRFSQCLNAKTGFEMCINHFYIEYLTFR